MQTKKKNQFSQGAKLELLDAENLPQYILENYQKFEKWLDKN